MTGKRKLATKLRSNKEKKMKVPIFYTDAWTKRRSEIKKRVDRKQKLAHERAEKRKKS